MEQPRAQRTLLNYITHYNTSFNIFLTQVVGLSAVKVSDVSLFNVSPNSLFSPPTRFTDTADAD